MPNFRTEKYTIKPSDSPEWIIIENPEGLAIDTEVKVLNFRYDCIPKKILINGEKVWCSRLCCYTGCYVTQTEIDTTTEILPKIIPSLLPDSQKVLEQNDNQIFIPDDYDEQEKLWKIRCAPEEWIYEDESNGEEDSDENSDGNEEENHIENGNGENDEDHNEHFDEENLKENNEKDEDNDNDEEAHIPQNHCIFLMENGLCATHKYFVDHNQDWVKVNNKFNICVTFPLDIRPQDKTLAFMVDFNEFTFGKVDCLSPDEKKKERLGYPQIIESMKYAIVDRYNEEW
ncbi:MAG: hypothetical protein ACTSWL_00720, partial [Promethearchaeota archaeon]